MSNPTFTRKHYRAIATMIRESSNLKEFTLSIAHFFKEDNRRFDTDKFLNWIGDLDK